MLREESWMIGGVESSSQLLESMSYRRSKVALIVGVGETRADLSFFSVQLPRLLSKGQP